MTGYPSNMDAHGPMRSEQQAREDRAERIIRDYRKGLITGAAAIGDLIDVGWHPLRAAHAINAALREGGESE